MPARRRRRLLDVPDRRQVGRRRSRRSPSSSAKPARRRPGTPTSRSRAPTRRWRGPRSSAPPSTRRAFDVMDVGPDGRRAGPAGRVLPGLGAQAAHRRAAGQRARGAVLERARHRRTSTARRSSTVTCSAGRRPRWRAPTRPICVVSNADGHSNGGIRPPAPPGTPPFWLVYFGPTTSTRRSAKVTELGGNVLVRRDRYRDREDRGRAGPAGRGVRALLGRLRGLTRNHRTRHGSRAILGACDV